jgi:NDP-mannose synthase
MTSPKKAVILAGGLGLRLRPFTEVIPKPLLPVGEKAVLEIQIERLKRFGFTEIYLATNYMSDFIEKFFGDGSRYGVTLHISREEKPLGTAGPLRLLRHYLPEPFLVMNGDILSLIDFSNFFHFALEKGTPLTLAIKRFITPYAFGNIFFNGDFVTGIEEKPHLVTFALAGIYVVRPEILDLIPGDEDFGMDKLIKIMLAQGYPIAKYEMSEYWLDIGGVDEYEKAQEIYRTHFKE